MSPKAGTVALVGRPNAGKSTLMNRLLREKVSIVSDKPQTTRHRMVGILSGDQGQMVFHDTPGIHKPMHRLNQQMVRFAMDALNDADAVALITDASKPFGKGDEHMLGVLERVARPKLVLLNKVDRVAKPKLLPLMQRYADSGQFEAIVPISALSGDGTEEVEKLLWDLLPEGEPLFDPELLTIHPERFLVSERIREKVLEQTRDELPYTTAVVLDRWTDLEDGRLELHASILVEKDGQKGIVIGKGGQMIKAIGTAARSDLQDFLERPIHLELHVRLAPHWRHAWRLHQEGMLSHFFSQILE